MKTPGKAKTGNHVVDPPGSTHKRTSARPELIQIISQSLKAKGWSPYELSRESKTNHATVYEALNGNTVPKPDTLTRWARALGIPDERLLIAAGHLTATTRDEADLLLSELKAELLNIPPEKRAEAIAVARGVLVTIAKQG